MYLPKKFIHNAVHKSKGLKIMQTTNLQKNLPYNV